MGSRYGFNVHLPAGKDVEQLFIRLLVCHMPSSQMQLLQQARLPLFSFS